MSDVIDLKSHSVSVALNLLLKDRTTEKNIMFATDAYEGIDFTMTRVGKMMLMCYISWKHLVYHVVSWD